MTTENERLHAEREKVSAECARLRKALEHWRHEVGKKQSQIDQLREQVAELERELSGNGS